MTINISIPDVGPNLHPQITVLGVGGSGSNAVNNMINSNLEGVDFAIANTDAQSLQISNCKKKIQLGIKSTRGLGAGMRPDIGRQAAEETINEISEMLEGSHMLFIAAGMGGGTGTGAAPVIAKLAREKGILTVGVVTKPFHFEGSQRMKLADKGLEELQQYVDTLLTIPNQNLFRIANEKTTFADAFKMADDVLYAGVRGVTDLMVQPGLINLDFSDVKTVMSEMGKAMMGTGEASGEGRAVAAAEAAIANPLIDDVSLKGAKGLIINITGGNDITLYEVDEAANRIKQEVDEDANIIYGTTCDERLDGLVRVSLVATGIDVNSVISPKPLENISSLAIDNSVYLKRLDESDEIQLNDKKNLAQEVTPEAVTSEEVTSEEITPEAVTSEEVTSEEITPEAVTSEEVTSEEVTPEAVTPEEVTSEEVTSEEITPEEVTSEEITPEEVTPEVVTSEEVTPEAVTPEEVTPEAVISEEVSATELEVNHSNVNEEKSIETLQTVRRLSLFDTLDSSDVQNLTTPMAKTEPSFQDSKSHSSLEAEEIEIEEEFSSQEIDSQDEFNQENEEELLDIPTFLRRQAN